MGTYAAAADFTTANQKLSAIPQNHALDAQQAQAQAYFVALTDIWEDISGNGLALTALPTATVTAIQAIADNDPFMAGAMSRGFLNTLYGYSYQVDPLDPSGGPLLAQAPNVPNGTGSAALAGEQYLTAQPNPARSSVAFQWQLPKGTEEATIVLTDLRGQVVLQREVSGQRGSEDWITDNVDAGIYLYHLRWTGGKSDTARLVIIK